MTPQTGSLRAAPLCFGQTQKQTGPGCNWECSPALSLQCSQQPCAVCPCRLPHRGPLGHDGRAHCSHKAGTDLQRPGQQGEPGPVCATGRSHLHGRLQHSGAGQGAVGANPPWCHGHCPAWHTQEGMSLAGGECPGIVRCQMCGRGRVKLWEGMSPVPALGCGPELPALTAPLCPAGLGDELQCQVCFVLLRPLQVGLSPTRCAQLGPGWLGVHSQGVIWERGLPRVWAACGAHWSLFSTLFLLLHTKRTCPEEAGWQQGH